MKKILIICFYLLSGECFSYTNKETVPLDKSIKYSAIVAIIDINKKETVANCGTLVSANVIRSFKGNKEPFQFWVKEETDLIKKLNSYFVILNPRKNQKTCLQSQIWTSSLAGRQNMFAFYPENKMFILANRLSFLSSNDQLDPGELIKTFIIFENKIHAVARWSPILAVIENELLK